MKLFDDLKREIGQGVQAVQRTVAPIRTPAPVQTPRPVASTMATPAPYTPGLGVLRTGVKPVAQPVMPTVQPPRGFVQSEKEAFTGAGLRGVRSAIGAAQGFSGLYDLAGRQLNKQAPQNSTSRVSKFLDQKAKTVDQTAANEGKLTKLGYDMFAPATDLLSFQVPGVVAGVAGKLPAVAKVAGKVAPAIQGINKAALPLTNFGSRVSTKLMPGTDGIGRVAGAFTNGLLSKPGLINTATGAALDLGTTASKGNEITPLDLGTSIASNALLAGGVPAGLQSVAEGARAIVPTTRLLGRGVQQAGRAIASPDVLNVKPHARITDAEISATRRVQSVRQGETDPLSLTNNDTILHQRFLSKAKLSPEDVTGQVKILKDRTDYDNTNIRRSGAVSEAVKTVKKNLPSSKNQSGYVANPFAPKGAKRQLDTIGRSLTKDDKAMNNSLYNAADSTAGRMEFGAPKTGTAKAGDIAQSRFGKTIQSIRKNPGGFVKVPGGKLDPAPDLHPEQKAFINAYANDLENMGAGNGVTIMPDGTRASNNVRSADNKGKAMTKRDWFDEARKQLESGKGMYDASDEYKAIQTAKNIEAQKKSGTIKPDDPNYWTTPIKGETKAKMPDVKDTNGHQPKEGDVIEFSGVMANKPGRTTVRWQEPHIANASGKRIEGQWLGNGDITNTKLPFTIVERDGKPFAKTASAPKSPQPQTKSVPATLQKSVVSSEGSIPPKMSIPEDAPSSGNRQRGLATTIQNDPNTPQAVKDKVTEFYKVRNTKDLQSRASNLVKDDAALARRVFESDSNSDVGTMIGSELSAHLSRKGEHEAAADIALRLAREATHRGQANQALSTWGKLAPESILRFTQKTVSDYNKKAGLTGGKGELQLTPEQSKDIFKASEDLQNMAPGRAKDIATQQMLKKVQEVVPASWVKKLGSFQTIGQLLNPKTLIRNIAGNALFSPLEAASQTVAAGLDKGLSSILKTERTTALPQLGTQVKGAIRGAKEQVQELNKGVNLGNETQYDLGQVPTFRKGAMARAEKALGYALRVPDRAAFTAAYDDTVQGLMKAQKRTTPTQEILDQAEAKGLYRTFQDNSTAAKLFTKLKGSLNTLGFEGKDGAKWGLGDLILKYPKTPGNLIARGIDYSPVGIASGIVKAASNAIAKKPFDQAALVNSIGRGTVGTAALMGTGAALGALGIITEKPSQDADTRNLQKASGQGGYQINTSALVRFMKSGFDKEQAKLKEGDTLVSYDWAQPASIPLSVGAAVGKKQSPKDAAVSTVAGISDGLNSLIEQPLVTGVNTFANNIKNKGIAGAGLEAIKGAPASFVPTISNQARQLSDNTTRNTYSDNTGQQIVQSIENKIPGLSKRVLPGVDSFGKDKQNYQNGSNNVGNVLFNPAFINKYKPNEAAKLPLDILSKTGETKQNPLTPKTKQTVNGKDIQLTPKQNSDFAKYIGSHTGEAYTKLSRDPEFLKLPQTEQAKKMSGMLTDINAAAKIAVLGDNPKNVGTSTKAILNGGTATYTDSSLASGLDKDSKNFLTKYNAMTTEDRKKSQETQNDFDYNYAVSKYANDTKNKTLNKAADISARNDIDKAKVGKDYSKEIRDLYSKNEDDIANFVTTDPDGKRYSDQLIAYDQALYNAGITSKLKYKGGIQSGGSRKASSSAAIAKAAVNYSGTDKLSRLSSTKLQARKYAPKGKLTLRKV